MSTTAMTLGERLKTETAEQHKRAENTEIQKLLVQGRVTREQYGAWLGQMKHVHAALESAVARQARADARVKIAQMEGSHAARIAADMQVVGASEAAALASTAALIEEIHRTDAVGLIGMHYVLEGSMNGGKFIAMGVRRGLGLTTGQGDTYLDPYGDRQRGVWAAWKGALDATEFTADECERVLSGAKAMFDGVTGLGVELSAR